MSTAESLPAHVTQHANLSILGRTKPDSIWDPAQYIVIPFVTAAGAFERRAFDIRRDHKNRFQAQQRGVTPLEFDKGRVRLSPYGEAIGCTLYRDICEGTAFSIVQGQRVATASLHPGVDGEKYWSMWLDYAARMRAGQKIGAGKVAEGANMDGFTKGLYHPEVARRRNEYARWGEVNAVDPETAISDILAASGVTREEVAAEQTKPAKTKG